MRERGLWKPLRRALRKACMVYSRNSKASIPSDSDFVRIFFFGQSVSIHQEKVTWIDTNPEPDQRLEN
jgi:hypothetical protein